MVSLLGTIRRSDVIFRANGQFDIKSRVVRALQMAPGDSVDVLFDGCNFYLYVARKADGANQGSYEAQCFPTKHAGTHFRGYSVRLCRAVLSACGHSRKVTLACGELTVNATGQKLISLITLLNLENHDK